MEGPNNQPVDAMQRDAACEAHARDEQPEEAKSAGALLLYDPDGKKGFFYAFNMPVLPGGNVLNVLS